MNPPTSRRNSYGIYVVTIAVLIIVSAAAAMLFHYKHTATPSNKNLANLSSYCVGQDFAVGSSGHCVQDIQVLAGYIHSHMNLLPSCNVTGAPITSSIQATGTYGSSDMGVVSNLQSWAQCYAKQEGFTTNVTTSGKVDKQTWGELCTYGYTDPIRSHVTGAGNSIAAGKDAGCPQLQS